MTDEVKNEEVKTEKQQARKSATHFLLLEIYDKEGNLVEGLDTNNIKVVADCKKPDEDFVLTVQSHPKAIIFKL